LSRSNAPGPASRHRRAETLCDRHERFPRGLPPDGLRPRWARSVLAADGVPDTARRRVDVQVPWRTLLKLIAAIALVWLWLQLVQLVLVLIVAVLLAVTLNPIVGWLEQRGWARWSAATLVGTVLAGIVAGFLWLT